MGSLEACGYFCRQAFLFSFALENAYGRTGTETERALNVNLTTSDIYQLEMVGSVVPTQIVCDLNVGFTFRNITEVRIDGLAFVSCARSHMVVVFQTYYGLYIQSVRRADISDCTFQDSYGSALGIVDSHVILRGNNSYLRNCRLCSNGCRYTFNFSVLSLLSQTCRALVDVR